MTCVFTPSGLGSVRIATIDRRWSSWTMTPMDLFRQRISQIGLV